MRLGELVQPDAVEDRNSRKLILRASAHWQDDTFAFTLPSHKAVRFFQGGTVLIRSSVPTLDARPMLLKYLSARDRAFPFHAPLWLPAAGSVPTRRWFMERLTASSDTWILAESGF